MLDIAQLIEQMTLEEKAALVTGANAWTTTPIPRLNLPALVCSDGPHGLRRVANVEELTAQSLPATCFPTASLLAATWDRELAHAVGKAIAEEAIALEVDVVLGPGNNMKRTPVCGRNFEYFSEDPYHSGEMASALVEGLQGQGVGASLKHFAANNQEYQRFSINAEVDERALRELYLPAFEKVVKQAKPWTVMCAYNKLNGEYCSEHYDLLVRILKQEWGFEGLVYSDWGAVHDRVKALQGGLDLEMPGPKPRRTQAVIDAVRNGQLDEAVLDESVRRILKTIAKAAETPKGGSFDRAAHHTLARRVAGEGMVLLKNNGILPLREPKRIAVIGRAAVEPHFQGGGSSHINPTQVDNPLEELRKLAGGAQVTHCMGYPTTDTLDAALIDEAVDAARHADVALLYIALPTYKESEGYDRADLDLTVQQVKLIRAVSEAQPDCVVILNNGSAVAMSAWIDGVAAVLEAWMMGQAGGGAIADILFGKVCPSGKLAETFPLKLADTPAHLNYPGENGCVRYGEGMYIGYRYYDARQAPVLFPFGHGLSYTTFAYSNLRLSAAEFTDSDGLTVWVDVTNTGKVAGKEIVQVYVHDHQASLTRPQKELKGFAKVLLEPGETKTVEIALDWRAFAFWHPAHKQWITEDGAFEILVGSSATEIWLQTPVMLRSSLTLPPLLSRTSTIRDWLNDKQGSLVFKPLFDQIIASMGAVFGGMSESMGVEAAEDSAAAGDAGGVGMDMLGFMYDTPLLSLLGFQEQQLPVAPEEIVDGLLAVLYAQQEQRQPVTA